MGLLFFWIGAFSATILVFAITQEDRENAKKYDACLVIASQFTGVSKDALHTINFEAFGKVDEMGGSYFNRGMGNHELCFLDFTCQK